MTISPTEFSSLLERYADLAVTVGMNVQPGQLVLIRGEAIHREFLYNIAKRSYQKGAKQVTIDLIEPRLAYDRVHYSAEEHLSYVSPSLTKKFEELIDEQGASCRVLGAENPLLMSGLDPQKVNTVELNTRRGLKRFYDEGISKSLVQWTLCSGATVEWAKRVFPALPAEEAYTALWRELFRIARVDTEDYLTRWSNHNAALAHRKEKLNALQLKSLHFKGPGTDLTVGLSPKARFMGGAKQSQRGKPYVANLPTEECFTTPDYRQTQGVVRATKPLFINGTLIKNATLRFTDGIIVENTAEEGGATLEAYLNSDPGARRLGEVALVGTDSPIFQSGLLFEEILLDENAACHIAVGSAYHYCLEGGSEMSKEERDAIGCNDSAVHTDFMISNTEVDVVGISYDGKRIPLLSKGAWEKDFL